MAVLFRDSTGVNTGINAFVISVPVPTLVEVGDLMIAIINLGPRTMGGAPAGWTHVAGSPRTEPGALANTMVVQTKIADAGDAAGGSYAWIRSSPNFTNIGGVILAFSGALEALDFLTFDGHGTLHSNGEAIYLGTDTEAEVYVTAIGPTGSYTSGPGSIILASPTFTEHEDVHVNGGVHLQVQSGPSTGPGPVSVPLTLTIANTAVASHNHFILGIGAIPPPPVIEPIPVAEILQLGFKKKLTHVVEGIDNLIEQFKDKPKIVKILSVYLRQVQELECVFSDILTETTLNNSVGVQLDNVGGLVGEARSGRNDLQYRTAIRARIGLNTSGGTIEDIIALAQSVAGAPVAVNLTEVFPAGFIAAIVDPIDPLITDVDRVASFVSSGKAGGVRGIITFGVLGSFQYDGPAGTGFDEGKYGGAGE